MKISFITDSIEANTGWARYSFGLLQALCRFYPDSIDKILVGGHRDQRTHFHGFETIPVLPSELECGGLRRYFGALKALIILREILVNTDAVHVLAEPYIPWIYFFLKIFRKKKFFITAHGTHAIRPLDRGLWRFVYRKAYREADKIFCVSHYTESLLKSRVPEAKTVVVNNGVDETIGKVKMTDDKQEYILSIGAFKKRKGYEISLRAFAKIAADFPRIKYVLAGSESNESYFLELKELVDRLHLAGRVVFKSNVSTEELASLYHNAKFFLLTPVNIKSSFEGFGLVYLEAGLFGKPSIGTKNNGSEDAIDDAITGLLVPQNDIEATAGAMRKLLADEKLREKLGTAARQKSLNQTWEVTAKKYVELYQAN